VQAVEVCQRLGRVDEARQILTRITDPNEASKTRCWDAEIARLNAELIRHDARHDPAAARQWFRTALATARAQGAQSLELRAALSYARAFSSELGDHTAREPLAEVVAAFHERAEILELNEAYALLSASAPAPGEPPPDLKRGMT
jgi:hypothetical protein